MLYRYLIYDIVHHINKLILNMKRIININFYEGYHNDIYYNVIDKKIIST